MPPEETPSSCKELIDYDYISWISNVSGRLFFHLTNGYNYRYDRIIGDVIHLNEKIQDTRIFFLSMLIDLRDEKTEGMSEYTRVIILAKTHQTDELSKQLVGSAWLIDDSEYKGLYKDNSEITLLHKIKTVINQKERKEFSPIYTSLEQDITNFTVNAKDKDIQQINFTIKDTGIVYLKKITSSLTKKDIDVDIKSIFYLLKFTFHKDRFHHSSAENIIQILSIQSISTDDKSKNLLIARKLLTGIKRYISETRKVGKEQTLFHNLKGVANYAQALINSLTKETILNTDRDKDFIKQEKDFLSTLTNSIEIELEKKPLKPNTIYQFISDIQAISVMALAILAPYIIISSKEIGTQHSTKISSNISDFVSDIFIPSYSTWFIMALLLIFTLRAVYDRTIMDSYIGKPIVLLYSYIMKNIRYLSKPALSNNIFLKYFFPNIINIEMLIRRGSSKNKTRLYVVVLFILTIIIISTLALII